MGRWDHLTVYVLLMFYISIYMFINQARSQEEGGMEQQGPPTLKILIHLSPKKHLTSYMILTSSY